MEYSWQSGINDILSAVFYSISMFYNNIILYIYRTSGYAPAKTNIPIWICGQHRAAKVNNSTTERSILQLTQQGADKLATKLKTLTVQKLSKWNERRISWNQIPRNKTNIDWWMTLPLVNQTEYKNRYDPTWDPMKNQTKCRY